MNGMLNVKQVNIKLFSKLLLISLYHYVYFDLKKESQKLIKLNFINFQIIKINIIIYNINFILNFELKINHLFHNLIVHLLPLYFPSYFYKIKDILIKTRGLFDH